jgi:solute carrier family 4 anion exchanger 2
MPDHINFTNPAARRHGLFIVPYFESFSKNAFAALVSLIAALLVFILLFVETEITELLLLRKEKGCRKGGGMNFDLILLAVCSLFCSVSLDLCSVNYHTF